VADADKDQDCQMAYFKPKIPIWETIGGSCNGRYWYILWAFGQFCISILYIFGTFVYFVVIWYIFRVLVYCTTKNLATLTKTTAAAAIFPGANKLTNSFLFLRWSCDRPRQGCQMVCFQTKNPNLGM
jgi:hypothetical protein